MNENNSPVASGSLNLASETGAYKYLISNERVTTGSGASLAVSNPKSSCKRILESSGSLPSGVYNINPTGNASQDVYCDMETDGGGWTAATMLADVTTKNLFRTNISESITSLEENVSTKGNIDDIWLDDENKDIMLKCYTDVEEYGNYNSPFIIYQYLKSDI